ncbi:hypothetical protein GCM10010517_01460 [Streptosporangium fragile]|uniref:RNA polymerase sigma-70 region 2 domain-containing protein n=1 Tax=Streptosporangium fragile TaxID=46186 RepID=A0ABN3VQ34_9ACTN
MTDSVLVEALRARDPGGLAALYDCYAESVYRYCCSMLGSPDSAQVALRDTLIAAEAHIHALADPRRLEAWLYALARGECVRRSLAAGPDPSPPDPAAARGGDADLRVMAWNAVRSLSPDDREVLELSCRHGLGPADLAAVLGVTARVAGALYESARERLRDVVTAEVLVRKGPYDCAGRAQLLAGFSGELTRETRERVIRHVSRCDTCAPHRVRQVSAAKVFDLLPAAEVPPTLRVRVMSCFTDPELVPYRRHVAQRVGLLDGAGFPAFGIRRSRRRSRVVAGAVAAVAAAAAIALIFAQVAVEPAGRRSGVTSESFPAEAEPPGVRLPREPEPADTPAALDPVGERSTGPVGSLGSTEPVSATGPVGPAFRIGAIPPGPVDRPVGGPLRPPVDDPADRPGEGPPDGPGDPAPDPVRPSPADPPSRPVLPPPRADTPDRPHRPHRDHHGRRPSDRPCRFAPGPTAPRPPYGNPPPARGGRGGAPRPPQNGRPPQANPRPPQNGPRPSPANPRLPGGDRGSADPGPSGPRPADPGSSRPGPSNPGPSASSAPQAGSPAPAASGAASSAASGAASSAVPSAAPSAAPLPPEPSTSRESAPTT